MSLTKNTTASANYILTTSSTTVAYAPTVEGVVAEGRIVPSHRITNPGVFTEGTVRDSKIAQYDPSA